MTSSQDPFYAISKSNSLTQSSDQYRGVSTSNDIALTKIVIAKNDGSPNPSNGYINLKGDIDDGTILGLPFKKSSTADINTIPQGDGVLYLDTSSVLSLKVGGTVYKVISTAPSPQIPVVDTLPDPQTFDTNFTTVVAQRLPVSDQNKTSSELKWYDTVSAAWKTITSS